MSTHSESHLRDHTTGSPVLNTGRGRWSATAPVSVAAPALGVIGAGIALLAGGWLMYAPFALGYQPAGADWANPTTTDFWTGLGLAVLAVIALAVLGRGLVGALRARGVIAPRRVASPPDPTPAAAPSAGDELSALLRPLVEALNRDNTTPAATATGAFSSASPTTNHRATNPAEL